MSFTDWVRLFVLEDDDEADEEAGDMD